MSLLDDQYPQAKAGFDEEDTMEVLNGAKRRIETLKTQGALLMQQREQIARAIKRNEDYLQEANQRYANILRRMQEDGLVDRLGEPVAKAAHVGPKNNSPGALTE